MPEPTIDVRPDRLLARAAARSTRYLRVVVQAPEATGARVPRPVNVALVLDRSGSMSDARKFDLAREAVQRALEMLKERDRFSVVVYDDRIDVLAPSTPATSQARSAVQRALEAVHPRGCTNLGEGWLRGCEQVALHTDGEVVSRCLLLTDGLANEGMTDGRELAMHAGELRRRGVATSTFGVGNDFDERLLSGMAHEGGGNAYFIEGASQIPQMIASELGEALEVTVREAALEITLPAGAEAEPLGRFRWVRTERGVRIELGDLVSSQELETVIKVSLPRGHAGEAIGLDVALAARGATEPVAEQAVRWTYADHAENDRQARDRVVDRAVATLYAARARAEATEANRRGDFDEARRVLKGTARRIRSYAHGDEVMLAIAGELESLVPEYSERQMDAYSLKASFYVAESATRARAPSGSARRKS